MSCHTNSGCLSLESVGPSFKILHLMDLMPPVILFNNLDATHVMLSRFMLHALLLFLIHSVVLMINIIRGSGKLDN